MPVDNSDELIGTTEMAELAGISFKDLAHWSARSYVVPHVPAGGSGRPRRWLRGQLGEVVEEKYRRGYVHRLSGKEHVIGVPHAGR